MLGVKTIKLVENDDNKGAADADEPNIPFSITMLFDMFTSENATEISVVLDGAIATPL